CVVAQHADGDTLGEVGGLVVLPDALVGCEVLAICLWQIERQELRYIAEWVTPRHRIDVRHECCRCSLCYVYRLVFVVEKPSGKGLRLLSVVLRVPAICECAYLSSLGRGGHGVLPLLVCAFDRSFPICCYYSRMGKCCQPIIYRSVTEVCAWFRAWRASCASEW